MQSFDVFFISVQISIIGGIIKIQDWIGNREETNKKNGLSKKWICIQETIFLHERMWWFGLEIGTIH